MTSVNEAKLSGIGTVNEQYAYSFDALNRLTGTDYSDGTIQKHVAYAYDRVGNRTSVTDPDGISTLYTYDARDRLRTVATKSAVTTYSYWENSLLKASVISQTASATDGVIADMSFAIRTIRRGA